MVIGGIYTSNVRIAGRMDELEFGLLQFRLNMFSITA